MLYVTGGYYIDNDNYIDDFYQINFSNNINYENFDINNINVEIKKMPNMLYKRASHSMIKIKDEYLFVFGGESDECEEFNFKLNKWGIIQKLPISVFSPMLKIHGDYLYVFIGYTYTQNYDLTEAFIVFIII